MRTPLVLFNFPFAFGALSKKQIILQIIFRGLLTRTHMLRPLAFEAKSSLAFTTFVKILELDQNCLKAFLLRTSF